MGGYRRVDLLLSSLDVTPPLPMHGNYGLRPITPYLPRDFPLFPLHTKLMIEPIPKLFKSTLVFLPDHID